MGSPISQETFLARALARFGNSYDYGKIVYKSYKTPIKIRCRTHPVKEISITPEKHLQTTGGCKFCLRQQRIRLLEKELNAPCPAPVETISPELQGIRVGGPFPTATAELVGAGD